MSGLLANQCIYNYTMTIKIELSGPQGNAFYIMSLVTNLGHQFQLEDEEVDAIIKEMKSSHYTHLLLTFIKHFGSVVEIYKHGVPYDCESSDLDE